MSRKTSSNSKSSVTGNGGAAEPLDVADVPDKLLESLHFAEEIERLSTSPELKELARKIVNRLDPAITAMSAAVDRLIATAMVEPEQREGEGFYPADARPVRVLDCRDESAERIAR